MKIEESRHRVNDPSTSHSSPPLPLISPIAASDAPERLASGSVVDQSETLVLCGGHVQAIVLQVRGRVPYQPTFQVVQSGGEVKVTRQLTFCYKKTVEAWETRGNWNATWPNKITWAGNAPRLATKNRMQAYETLQAMVWIMSGC